MAHAENTLKDLKRENLIALLAINLQNDREKLMKKSCERLDTISNIDDNLSSKLDLVKSSLIVTKTVNDNLLNLNCITTLERSLHDQEQCSRRMS